MEEQPSNDPITQRILDDLHSLKTSQPTEETLQSYRQLFTHVQQRNEGKLSQWLQSLTASLAWDSRQQGLGAGARSSTGTAPSIGGGLVKRDEYRLLYASDRAEIELMILPEPSSCHIEGDIVLLGQSETSQEEGVPALISLQPTDSAQRAYEVESDQMGRFRISGVTTGEYTMQIILKDGVLITVESVTLS